MKRILIVIALVFAVTESRAQSTMKDVLAMIERNNSTLAALRKQAEAEKIGNKTDIYLAAPEIGYDFLPGSPSEIGNRHDVSVSQTFDLATVSGKRSKVADGQNALVDCAMRTERLKLMLEAKLHLVDLVYYNKALRQLNQRFSDAQALAEGGRRMLDAGECSLMDYNNVQLACMSIEVDVKKMEAERQRALQELARLNGGSQVDFASCEYDSEPLTEDFQSWYDNVSARHPGMEFAIGDIELSRRQLSLAKAEALPDITLGYMSEKTKSEHFQGVSVGVSVPLWNNKNKVRKARASMLAAEARKDDASVQLRSQLRLLYDRVAFLGKVADTCDKAVASYDRSLLQRALDAGEISKIEFFLQSAAYYDVADKALAASHEYQSALAQLMAVDL